MAYRAALLAASLAFPAGMALAQISIPEPPPEPEVVDPEVAAEELAKTVAELPPVDESVGTSYYLVQGSTLEGLEEAMRAKGPDALAGQGIWNVSYGLEPCTVSLSATISMPKLIGKSAFTDEDMIVWEEMLTALEAYQQEHVAIGREAATEVRSLNCTTEEEGGIEAVIAKYREKSAAMDESTENGAKSGVRLTTPEA
ncbi:DUF922 domain-containing protein [Algicella marina]|uniref:DUF922 domain-containing protein n=1 Tax=Algicella marina TaxID=2683284 RepID=A0A6P1T282_9RHOB|nr:DUF922 domain-containing protein [Algicella marina]QHQ37044.1 DUF922 domain-containing protein [Algicella marina]